MQTSLTILGNLDGFYVRDLLRAAQEVKEKAGTNFVDVDCRSYSELTTAISESEEFDSRYAWMKGTIIVRSMPLGSLEQIIFRINSLHWSQRHGARIINRPRSLEIAIDKWLTLDLIAAEGIKVPRTICCQTRDQALVAFESLNRSAIIKPIFGGEGRGLMRIDDIDLAHRVFTTIEQLRSIFYLQEFIDHPGRDLRILFVGNRHFAIHRQASKGDWRTNLARGGLATKAEPSEHQMHIAETARRIVDADILGVDIITGSDGVDRLLEINAVPGWKGVAKAYDVDISRLVIEHAIHGDEEAEGMGRCQFNKHLVVHEESKGFPQTPHATFRGQK